MEFILPLIAIVIAAGVILALGTALLMSTSFFVKFLGALMAALPQTVFLIIIYQVGQSITTDMFPIKSPVEGGSWFWYGIFTGLVAGLIPMAIGIVLAMFGGTDLLIEPLGGGWFRLVPIPAAGGGCLITGIVLPLFTIPAGLILSFFSTPQPLPLPVSIVLSPIFSSTNYISKFVHVSRGEVALYFVIVILNLLFSKAIED